MNTDDNTDPVPEVAEERYGRRRMWTLFILGIIVVIVLVLIGKGRVAHPSEAVKPMQDSVR